MSVIKTGPRKGKEIVTGKGSEGKNGKSEIMTEKGAVGVEAEVVVTGIVIAAEVGVVTEDTGAHGVEAGTEVVIGGGGADLDPDPEADVTDRGPDLGHGLSGLGSRGQHLHHGRGHAPDLALNDLWRMASLKLISMNSMIKIENLMETERGSISCTYGQQSHLVVLLFNLLLAIGVFDLSIHGATMYFMYSCGC